MPQDSGPSSTLSRIGASCARSYPYPVEGPRARPWRRVALALAPLALATAIGSGLAWVLIEWTFANW
jgi:hypothetical protein